MKFEGGCYCGAVRYTCEGDPLVKAQCHCRECQYLTGGAPNMFVAMPEDGFVYVKGEPKQFSRSDLERPVTREFCPECGTHLLTRSPARPGAVIVKVGGKRYPLRAELIEDPATVERVFQALAMSNLEDLDGVALYQMMNR